MHIHAHCLKSTCRIPGGNLFVL